MSNPISPGSAANVNVNVRALASNPNVTAHFKTKILPKNVNNNVNVLTQALVNEENTKYVVKHDYVLSENIVIPAGCIIEFDGGSINNASGNSYTLTGTSTKVVNLYNYTVFTNLTPTGITTFTGNYV